MFFKIIKDFFIRKKVKQLLLSYKLSSSPLKINKIGVIIDETFFNDTEPFLALLNNISQTQLEINVLVYSDKKVDKTILNTLQYKYIGGSGKINHEYTNIFLNQNFDMLIGYYDLHKPIFKLLSLQSKANFKVGINKINKKINHLVIQNTMKDYEVFVAELTKYLKILNKI